MIKSQEELTLIEKELFNTLIRVLHIKENAIKNYIIKIYEKPHMNMYCINYYSDIHDTIVQSRGYEVDYLKKELRKGKLLKIKNL